MKRTKADDVAEQQGCYFDPVLAEQPIRFAERFFRSQFIKGNFRFLPWQAEFLRYVYGWRLRNGNRRFRLVTLHTPKKSGKTLLVSIVSFYELLAAGEPSALVLSCAPSRENAGQVYDEVNYALERSPFAKHVQATPHIKRLKVKQLNAEFRSLASDGRRVHGYNASAAIVDEAAWVKPDLWNAVRYCGDARPNHLCLVISTAGDDPTTWYHGLYQKAKRILSGDDLDTGHAAFVYEHDITKPPEDEAEWVRANPSIGTAFPLDQFRRDFQAAKESGVGEFLNFQRLKLNRWVRPEEAAWLDVSDFANHRQEPAEDELANCPSAIGVDLSEAGDPSSVSQVFALGEGRFFVRSWAWLCEAGIRNRERAANLPRYDAWIEEGSLTVTDGDMIDARLVRDHILDLCQRYEVRSVNFDPRSAYMIGQEIGAEGYETQRIPQSFRFFTPLLNEFGRAWREGRVTHNGSDWLRYCLSNVRVETNRYQEVRPYRKKSVDHIDGAIATLLGYHSHVTEAPSQAGVFLVG